MEMEMSSMMEDIEVMKTQLIGYVSTSSKNLKERGNKLKEHHE